MALAARLVVNGLTYTEAWDMTPDEADAWLDAYPRERVAVLSAEARHQAIALEPDDGMVPAFPGGLA